MSLARLACLYVLVCVSLRFKTRTSKAPHCELFFFHLSEKASIISCKTADGPLAKVSIHCKGKSLNRRRTKSSPKKAIKTEAPFNYIPNLWPSKKAIKKPVSRPKKFFNYRISSVFLFAKKPRFLVTLKKQREWRTWTLYVWRKCFGGWF